MRAIAVDPIVAEHYAGLDASQLRAERLTRPLTAHVSYRIGNKVYWTKRKLQVAAGEEVLTDGTTTLRARCGNIISTVRRTPVFAGEPEEAEFDVTLEPVKLASHAMLLRPEMASVRLPEVRRRVVGIPGPSTLVLLGFGIAAGVVAGLYARSNPR